MCSRLLPMFLWALLLGALPAQRTWTVDRLNRPGTDFTDLPDAVAGAGDGDVLFLRYVNVAANLVSYTAPTIDGKGLIIRGDPTQPPEITGVITVRNLTANQQVVFAHLHLGTLDSYPVQNPGQLARGLTCVNNIGGVHLVSVVFGFYDTLFGYSSRIVEGETFNLADCSLLTITNSTIHLVWRSHRFIRSNVIATTTRFGGGIYPEPGFFIPVQTIAMEFSRLWLVDSIVEGTNAGPHSALPLGWVGIALCSSELRIAGTSVVYGGRDWGSGYMRQPIEVLAETGHPNYASCYFYPGITAHEVYLDPRANTYGYITELVTWYHQRIPSLASQLGTPSPFAANIYSHVGAPVLAATSFLLSSPVLRIEGLPLHLDPGAINILGAGLADSSGTFRLQLPVGPVPLPGATVGVQAVELLPNGMLGLSNVVAPLWYQ